VSNTVVGDLPVAGAPSQRMPIPLMVSVMLATIMQAVDSTIANVALPHMQGAMSATQDQIAWVLTSYVVASAVFMPLTGFLSSRLGQKRLFLISTVGFTVVSMLCGAAQSLEQILVFRLLQGAFGAFLVPLSQTVLLDSTPPAKHPTAMAFWGVGVMVGPILGPTMGGYLTEYFSWRWVFYINLPIGLLAWAGITAFMPEKNSPRRRFDVLGFALLSISLATLQLMLDRGESQGWFDSTEIIFEALVAGLCLYMFIVHMMTGRSPYLDPSLFRDRNYCGGLTVGFVAGVILMATMALLPPYLQHLGGYPVLDVGLLLAPRGLGTMAAMVLVGKLGTRVDPRHEILLGLALIAYSLYEMSLFVTHVPERLVLVTGVIQGFGLGLVMVPLSATSFSTLTPAQREDGTSLYSLVRNLGGSIGISLTTAALLRNGQANHAQFSEHITPFNPAFQQALTESAALHMNPEQGLVLVNQMVNEQAMTLAYLQDFRLMMWMTLLAMPIVFLLQNPHRKRGRRLA
jgi:DHA2 family multidrug resistance protein